MKEYIQNNIVALASEKGYDRFHPQWFENNKLNSDSWFLECCLLQKWLRETHNIEVPTIYFDKGYLYAVTKKPAKGNHYRVEYSNTYEEALEKGLFEALNLLPNV